MGSLLYTILITISIATALFAVISKILTNLSLDASQKQFDLLKKIVGNAVAHVNQISLNEDITSSQKKQLAIEIATDLASNFGINSAKLSVIATFIESILWDEDDSIIDDEDEEDELM